LIKPQIANLIGEKILELTFPKYIMGINNKSSTINSYIEWKNTRFHITEMKFQMLIGMDFLKTANAHIDIINRKAILFGKEFGFLASIPDYVNVVTESDVVVHKANDIVQLPQAYPDKELNEDFIVLVEHDGLKALIQRYQHIFCKELPIGHKANLPAMKISMQEQAEPFKLKPYPQSIQMIQIMEQEVKRLLNQQIIEEADSEFCSPVVAVRKKDGGLRFCVDYRQLNSITKAYATFMPNPETYLQRFKGANIFSILDMAAGYHQLEIEESSRAYTGFSIALSGKTYQFTRCPFGLKNAPSMFQQRIYELFRELDYVLVYFDDIIIFSSNVEQHMKHLQTVLKILSDAKVLLKYNKCKIGSSSVDYLGHHISSKGISPTAEKIESLEAIKEPKSPTEVQSLIGFLSYYRKFIPSFPSMISAIYNTLTTKPFKWTEIANVELKKIKLLLASSVLSHPDFSIPFEVFSDASENGIGGCINQNGKPVAFYSRKLIGAETRYSIPEKEALAILFVLERAAGLLGTGTFILHADSSVVVSLFKNPKSKRLARYAIRLSEFDFIIKHIPGRENKVADHLSRVQTFDLMTVYSTNEDEKLKWIQAEDADLFNLLKIKPQIFKSIDGIVYLNPHQSDPFQRLRPVIPAHARVSVIADAHNSQMSGHMGYTKTLQRILATSWFPNAKQMVKDFVRRCSSCQLRKGNKTTYQLQPILTRRPMEMIHCDLIGPLIVSNNNKYILVIVDNFSRFVTLRPIPDKTSSSVVQGLLEFIGIFGLPKIIMSDRGTEFRNNMNILLCKALNVQRRFTSSYHPQSNGVSERINSSIHRMLGTYLKEHNQWSFILPIIMNVLNNCVHPSTGFTPFQLLFAHDSRIENLKNDTPPEGQVKHLVSFSSTMIVEAMQRKLEAVLALSKLQTVKEIPYVKGQLVKVFDIARTHKANQYQKWTERWKGPMKIIEIRGLNVLVTGPNNREYSIHVSRLAPWNKPNSLTNEEKEHKTSDSSKFQLNDTIEDEEELPEGYFMIDKIIKHRNVRGQMQYRVRWSGYEASDDTWELPSNIPQNFITDYYNSKSA